VDNFVREVDGLKEHQARKILECAKAHGDSGGNRDDGEDNDTTGNRIVTIGGRMDRVEKDLRETSEKLYAIFTGRDS